MYMFANLFKLTFVFISHTPENAIEEDVKIIKNTQREMQQLLDTVEDLFQIYTFSTPSQL